MFLEIVTPEASIFQGEVDSVTVPGVTGYFQLLNQHAPIVSLLQAGKVQKFHYLQPLFGYDLLFFGNK